MRLDRRKRRIMGLIIACQLCLLCGLIPLHAEDHSPPATRIAADQKKSAVAEETGAVEARAYYYAKRHNKKRTSSGAVYDPRKLTAAHPTIALGTRIKVVNLANDRSVLVTVNDRCRRHRFEFIDLSRAAARELGFLGNGMARVRIIPIAAE